MGFSLLTALCLVLLLAPPVPSGALELFSSREKGFAYLVLNGIIEPADVTQVKAALDFNLKKRTPTAILLTSTGGQLAASEDLADILMHSAERFYRRYQRPTLLVINEECSSACAVVTALITKWRDPRSLILMVTPSSIFGLHAGASGRMVKGRFIEDKDPKARRRAILEQIQALRDADVNREWLAHNDSLFHRRGVTPLKAAQLCRQKTGIIPADSCLRDDADVIPLIQERLAGN
ncbi:MAG: hypothetical protein HC902_08740 [Calothrix sp. SM1_5_4]|nr:hypothetical protein [Calothrix sp. SM1_5_4]